MKQYQKEDSTFADCRKKVITDKKKILKIIKTMSNRFQIREPVVVFNLKDIDEGTAYKHKNVIELGSEGTTPLIIAHELSHMLTVQRFKELRHNKRHYKWVCRMCHYVRKRNYFNISDGSILRITEVEILEQKYFNMKDPKYSLD